MALDDRLERAAGGTAVQVLGPNDSTTVTITTSGSSQTLTIPVGAEIYELNLQEDCYVEVGGSAPTATASSRFLPAGSYYYRTLPDQLKVALLNVTTAGKATCTEVK